MFILFNSSGLWNSGYGCEKMCCDGIEPATSRAPTTLSKSYLIYSSVRLSKVRIFLSLLSPDYIIIYVSHFA